MSSNTVVTGSCDICGKITVDKSHLDRGEFHSWWHVERGPSLIKEEVDLCSTSCLLKFASKEVEKGENEL